MNPFEELLYLPVFFGCLLLFCIAVFVIRVCILEKKSAEPEAEEPQEAAEPELTPAHVTAKRIQHGYAGSAKTPKYMTGFVVTFLTEDDEIMEFSVSQELFDSLYEGQSGMLVTLGGDFFDFGDGEDIPEEL